MIPNMFATNRGSAIYTCSDLCVHVGQSDAWSCGYRNLQMLLSLLLPTFKAAEVERDQQEKKREMRLKKRAKAVDMRSSAFVDSGFPSRVVTPSSGQEVIDLTESDCDADDDVGNNKNNTNGYKQRYFGFSVCDGSNEVNAHHTLTRHFPRSEIPSVATLQRHLENSWRQGFDPEGAQHYRMKVSGGKEWIGAAEVACLLNYFSVHASVIQFIKSPASKAVLGPFVYYYFSQKEDVPATRILQMAQQWSPSEIAVAGVYEGTQSRCPLYLQWEGHSVTIVGIELTIPKKHEAGVLMDPNNIELLLFDPQKKGSAIKNKLTALAKGSWNELIRLPAIKLLKKDCQIVHCSLQMLSGYDRYAGRRTVRGLTAKGMNIVTHAGGRVGSSRHV